MPTSLSPAISRPDVEATYALIKPHIRRTPVVELSGADFGLAPFRLLLNDRRFVRVPKVLETPKEPEPAADLRNLAVLRRLRRRTGR